MISIAPISVVIPAYNAEKYIRQAIRSVQNQTVNVAEIIVADNFCTDRTAEIAREMGAVVLEKPENNQGVSAARNRGIRAARGEWIAFLDADDYWDKRKIEYQWQAIQDCPDAGMVSCYTRLTGSETRLKDSRLVEWIYKTDYRSSHNRVRINKYCSYFPKVDFVDAATRGDKHISSVMVKREVIARVGDFNQDLCVYEDLEFTFRILNQFPWVLVHRRLSNYRRHSDNTTSSRQFVDDNLPQLIEQMNRSPEAYPPGVFEFYLEEAKRQFIKKGQNLTKSKSLSREEAK